MEVWVRGCESLKSQSCAHGMEEGEEGHPARRYESSVEGPGGLLCVLAALWLEGGVGRPAGRTVRRKGVAGVEPGCGLGSLRCRVSCAGSYASEGALGLRPHPVGTARWRCRRQTYGVCMAAGAAALMSRPLAAGWRMAAAQAWQRSCDASAPYWASVGGASLCCGQTKTLSRWAWAERCCGHPC